MCSCLGRQIKMSMDVTYDTRIISAKLYLFIDTN
jgi:hypothetical protein